MIGEKAYRNALLRRDALKKELAEIESFLHLAYRFAGVTNQTEGDEPPSHTPPPVSDQIGPTGEHTSTESPGNRRTGPNRTQMLETLRHIILEAGRPLQRGALAEAAAAAGLHPQTKDPSNYFGTVMWRARDQFATIPGHGYWPSDVDYPQAGYVAGQNGNAQSGADTDEHPDENMLR